MFYFFYVILPHSPDLQHRVPAPPVHLIYGKLDLDVFKINLFAGKHLDGCRRCALPGECALRCVPCIAGLMYGIVLLRARCHHHTRHSNAHCEGCHHQKVPCLHNLYYYNDSLMFEFGWNYAANLVKIPLPSKFSLVFLQVSKIVRIFAPCVSHSRFKVNKCSGLITTMQLPLRRLQISTCTILSIQRLTWCVVRCLGVRSSGGQAPSCMNCLEKVFFQVFLHKRLKNIL